MKLTVDVFEAFLKCPTKCWLRATGELPSGNAYAEWVKSQSESYHAEAAKQLIEGAHASECGVALIAENLRTAKWRLAVGVELCIPFDAVVPYKGSKCTLPADNFLVVSGSLAKLNAPLSAVRPSTLYSLVAALHAVERVPSAGRGKPAQFIPIRFIFSNKLTKDDRLLLAFDAFVLSKAL